MKNEPDEVIDLHKLGLCSGEEVLKYTCLCGEKTEYHQYSSCWWMYDSQNSNEDTQIYYCYYCGAVKEETYLTKPTGKLCEVELTTTVSYSLNGVVVYSYSYKENVVDHGEDKFIRSYKLFGATCEDGVFLYGRCTACGKEEGSYIEDCNTYYCITATNTSGKSVCFTKAVQYSCPCGQSKYMTVGGDGSCTYGDNHTISTNGNTTTATYTCTKCGGTRKTVDTTTTGANCRVTNRIDYTYKNKYGTVVASGARVSSFAEHQTEYTYELLGESCEDGIRVTTSCKNCDLKSTDIEYEHHTTYTEYDLSAFGSCSPSFYVRVCRCGENVYTNLDWNYDTGRCCQMGYVSETETERVERCYYCKLVMTTVKNVKFSSGCKEVAEYTVTFTKDGMTPVTATYTETNFTHNYDIYTLTMEEGAKNCEDGFRYSAICTKCGKKDEGTRYYHDTFPVERESLAVEGGCNAFELITYSCGCGEDSFVDLDFGDCKMDYVGYTVKGDQYLRTYTCELCGVTAYSVEFDQLQEGQTCRYMDGYDWLIYDSMEADAAHLGTMRTYRYDYRCLTVYDVELFGDSCEDGYSYTTKCAVCGRESGGNWYDPGEVDCDWWAAYGAVEAEKLWDAECGAQLWALYYSCPCGNQPNTWGVTLVAGESYSTVKDHIGENYCLCGECDLRWVTTRTEGTKGENCKTNYTWAITIYEGETVVKTQEKTYAKSAHNDVAAAFTCNGDDCNYGYTVTLTCADCGRTHKQEGYWHDQYNLMYGSWTEGCGGYIKASRCACGYFMNEYINNKQCLNSLKEWSAKDAQGVVHEYEQRSCKKCGIVLTYDRVYTVKAGETCVFDVDVTVTVVLGQTALVYETYSLERVEHDVQATYRLAEGADSCEDGLIETVGCIRCDDYDGGYTDTVYEHRLTEQKDGRIDLAAYGAECGAELVKYACPCGAQMRYDFGDDSVCDVHEEETEGAYWIEGKVTGNQFTSSGNNWFENYGVVFTCAVTDPACGLKIRMGEYWVAEEGCMAAEYQVWQLGYDEATGTCQKEVKLATGERKVYHDYESVYNDGGFEWRYEHTCKDCGSTCIEECVRDGNGYTYKDVAVNTLYAKNGEPKKYTVTQSYIYWELTGENLSGDRYEETEYADNTVYWERETVTYSVENGCVKTLVRTDSDDNRRTYTYEHAEGHYIEKEKPSCTQHALESQVCDVCGMVQYYDYMSQPTDHKFVYDASLQTYVCSQCGLENANGASGAIVMEELTDHYKNLYDEYLIGYWMKESVNFTHKISVVLVDSQSAEKELTVVGVDVQYLTQEADGYRAAVINKDAVFAAAEAAMATVGYNGRYAIRFTFVPSDSSTQFDYSITFDPVYP